MCQLSWPAMSVLVDDYLSTPGIEYPLDLGFYLSAAAGKKPQTV